MKTKMLIFMIFLLFNTSCGEIKLSSQWKDRDIQVDGNLADWQGQLLFLEKHNASIGLLNDADYLYFCLTTSNQQLISKIRRMGFTLWFDADGGKDKDKGLHYPLGMMDMMGFQPQQMPNRNTNNPPGMEGIPENLLSELEIWGADKEDRKRMKISEVTGLEVAVGDQDGTIVYELKIPLNNDATTPFAIGTTAGQSINVGLETPQIDFSEFRNRMSGRTPPGGFPGRPGGMRGGRGGRMPGNGFERPEPLDVWAKVQLANEK